MSRFESDGVGAAKVIRNSLECGRDGCDCARASGKVHCPVHDSGMDGRPDLSVTSANRRPLVHCHVCGQSGQESIVAALKATGAWPTSNRARRGACVQAERTSWPIRDVHAETVAIHERIDHADGAKSFVWRLPNGRKGLGGRKTSSLPLYGSELLADLPPGSTIVLCEGEKAADAVRRLGIVALGTVTGAGNPVHDDAALRTLVPFELVLWPDNDDKGRAHMEEIGRRLLALGDDT